MKSTLSSRPFWKRFVAPTVIILTGMLVSMLMIPVGSANWTETLYVTGSIHPAIPYPIEPGDSEIRLPVPTSPPEPVQDATETEDTGDPGNNELEDKIELPETPEPEEVSFRNLYGGQF